MDIRQAQDLAKQFQRQQAAQQNGGLRSFGKGFFGGYIAQPFFQSPMPVIGVSRKGAVPKKTRKIRDYSEHLVKGEEKVPAIEDRM